MGKFSRRSYGDALRWKIADVVNWIHGSPGCEIDPRVYDKDYDTVFAKRAPSIFFETGVSGFFVQEGVDTVILVGVVLVLVVEGVAPKRRFSCCSNMRDCCNRCSRCS